MEKKHIKSTQTLQKTAAAKGKRFSILEPVDTRDQCFTVVLWLHD